jgi:hypothetical protein
VFYFLHQTHRITQHWYSRTYLLLYLEAKIYPNTHISVANKKSGKSNSFLFSLKLDFMFRNYSCQTCQCQICSLTPLHKIETNLFTLDNFFHAEAASRSHRCLIAKSEIETYRIKSAPITWIIRLVWKINCIPKHFASNTFSIWTILT